MVPMKPIQTQTQGFTLVELILVVSIIGLFTGIALPNFLSNWEDERLNAATKIAVAHVFPTLLGQETNTSDLGASFRFSFFIFQKRLFSPNFSSNVAL